MFLPSITKTTSWLVIKRNPQITDVQHQSIIVFTVNLNLKRFKLSKGLNGHRIQSLMTIWVLCGAKPYKWG